MRLPISEEKTARPKIIKAKVHHAHGNRNALSNNTRTLIIMKKHHVMAPHGCSHLNQRIACICHAYKNIKKNKMSIFLPPNIATWIPRFKFKSFRFSRKTLCKTISSLFTSPFTIMRSNFLKVSGRSRLPNQRNGDVLNIYRSVLLKHVSSAEPINLSSLSFHLLPSPFKRHIFIKCILFFKNLTFLKLSRSLRKRNFKRNRIFHLCSKASLDEQIFLRD